MIFSDHIQMHDSVIQNFHWSIQDSSFKPGKVSYHNNRSQNIWVPPSQHLFFVSCSIYEIINNRIIFLMPVEYFPWYGMIPAVLSGLTFSVLSTKVS